MHQFNSALSVNSDSFTWITHLTTDGQLFKVNSLTGATEKLELSHCFHGTEISSIQLLEGNQLRLSFVAMHTLEHLQVQFARDDNPSYVTHQARGLLAGLSGMQNAYQSPKGQFRIKFSTKYGKTFVNYDVLAQDPADICESESSKGSSDWTWSPAGLCPYFINGERGAKSFLGLMQHFLGEEPQCTISRTALVSFS